MHVTLTDGRSLSVPIIWFPLLQAAAPEQRIEYEIGAGDRFTGLSLMKISLLPNCLPGRMQVLHERVS
jgi:hypothetical protein